MVNWNGAILPIVNNKGDSLSKHVQSVEFRPLRDMTAEDWAVLDWPELRPVPRRRIQDDIIDGNLEGFYVVDIDMSKAHGGKPRYFWPGKADTPAPVDASAFEGYAKNVGPLRQFEDESADLDSVSVDQLRSELATKYGFDRGRMLFWPEWAVRLSWLAVIHNAKEQYDNANREPDDWTAR